MREKSAFTSKKISSRIKKKRTPSRSKTSEIKKSKNNSIFDNQEIKQNLQSFYDKEAQKYAETRKKFWHEEKVILDAISPIFNDVISNACEKSTIQNESNTPMDSSANASEGQKTFLLSKEGEPLAVGDFKNPQSLRASSFKKERSRKIRVLEFGCGSGRFATLLNQHFPGQFDYTGIDLSEELLSYARKDNPNLTFIQGDITKLITDFGQESFDLIVGTSSFQHIPSFKERSFLMKSFYRLLNYDGMLLMTNRSLSKRFTKKNWKIVLETRILSWLKFDKGSSRDLMVPRTDSKGKVYERFYHFFSLKELEKLAIFSGLTIKTNTYIDENGEFTDNEKASRSSLFVSKKSPIIN